MVSLSNLKSLAENIKANDSRFLEIVFCVDDAQAINKLKDKKGPLLVMLYPEAEGIGGQDEAVDTNATWLFILEKGKTGQKETDEFAQMEKLQDITLKARLFVENHYYKPTFCYLRRYKPGSSSVIPEYNQFGGFNGWSMSLVF